MNWVTSVIENHRRKVLLFLSGVLSLLMAFPASAKLATDFDPTRDFLMFKTFAFIGGVEQLVRMQLNPDQLSNQIHRAVTRELTSKGLHEVRPEENPDLVVRYFVESQKNAAGVASNMNWGYYGSYYGYHWGYVYSSLETPTEHMGTLGIDLIDPHSRDLAWRMLVNVKIINSHPEKIWKTADGNIKNAFKSYPPSPKEIEEKKQQWAKEDAAKKASESK